MGWMTATGGAMKHSVRTALRGVMAMAAGLPARTVGTYAYVNPVVAVALGALILDEPLSAGLLIGGLLILVSVLVSTMSVSPRPVARPREKKEEAAA